MRPQNNLQRFLDFAGSIVDAAFLSVPAIMFPFAHGRKLTAESYEKDLRVYIDSGYCEEPRKFFQIPVSIPAPTVTRHRPYRGGFSEIVSWPSAYRPRNPNLRAHWERFEENKNACLIRWSHGKPHNKTVLCLHGFMLGEPKQAERMFRVQELFDRGLDVALFITPFHWRRRASKKLAARGAFLQPNDVCMTAEAIGQTMYDLHAAFAILRRLGASHIGLIGASLGGFHAALFGCLSDLPAFCALMVPAAKFQNPLERPLLRKLSGMPDSVIAQAIRVWDFTSPLNMMPKISQEKILIVASRGDRVCPSQYTRQLATHWSKTKQVFLTGGHWLIFNRKERGRAWYTLLVENGFIPPRAE